MIRTTIGIIAWLVFSCHIGQAAWYPRLDSGGKLIVTGVAINPDKTTTAIYLTCSAERLKLEVLTAFNGEADDLVSFAGTKIILGFKNELGESKKMGLEGVPVVSAGGLLSVDAELTSEQSRMLAKSIARGYRLDVELVHTALVSDRGAKAIMSDGYTGALLAMAENCPALGL